MGTTYGQWGTRQGDPGPPSLLVCITVVNWYARTEHGYSLDRGTEVRVLRTYGGPVLLQAQVGEVR